MSKELQVTAEMVRERFRYDPETGEIFHLKDIGGCRAGELAGSRMKSGYLNIGINGLRFLAHRVAWLYMTGEWPPMMIDHKDGHKHNNRWNNLRPATPTQNNQNSAGQKRNASGHKGVTWYPKSKKWRVLIRYDNKQRHIGLFETIEEARAAYKEVAEREFGEFAKCD